MVKVRPLDQKRLLGVAGRHAVITDRKVEEGGSDVGCTSGELLLLAIGSCATGALRNFLKGSGFPVDGLEVDVDLEPAPVAGERDAIAIRVCLPAEVLDGRLDAIATAAQSGRVVSRMRLGSRVLVRCQPSDVPSMAAAREEATAHE
jgi:organic hydroperoxide reductase OsmC/OhrA